MKLSSELTTLSSEKEKISFDFEMFKAESQEES